MGAFISGAFIPVEGMVGTATVGREGAFKSTVGAVGASVDPIPKLGHNPPKTGASTLGALISGAFIPVEGMVGTATVGREGTFKSTVGAVGASADPIPKVGHNPPKTGALGASTLGAFISGAFIPVEGMVGIDGISDNSTLGISMPLARSVGDTKLNGHRPLGLGCSVLIDGISGGVIVGTLIVGAAGALTVGTGGISAPPNGHNTDA